MPTDDVICTCIESINASRPKEEREREQIRLNFDEMVPQERRGVTLFRLFQT